MLSKGRIKKGLNRSRRSWFDGLSDGDLAEKL
jgi:hypothetical protein